MSDVQKVPRISEGEVVEVQGVPDASLSPSVVAKFRVPRFPFLRDGIGCFGQRIGIESTTVLAALF